MSVTFKQQKLTLNIIWGAMAWSILLYWIIYGMITGSRDEAGSALMTERPAVTWYVLISAGCANLLGGWMWHSWRIGQVSKMITPSAFVLLSPAERVVLQSQLQAVAIVAMALFESAALIGLVLGFLGCPIPYVFHSLAAASLLCLVLYRVQGYHEIFGALEKLETRPQQSMS